MCEQVVSDSYVLAWVFHIFLLAHLVQLDMMGFVYLIIFYFVVWSLSSRKLSFSDDRQKGRGSI